MKDFSIEIPTKQTTQKFQPYFPLQLNGNLFTDPQLSDLEKTIIALAQNLRLQVAYARNEEEQKKLLNKFTSSYFAAATGKHRDHIRRIINKMQSSEAVNKYVSIFILPKIEFNTEQIFRFSFKDHLPDMLNMKRVKEVDQEENTELKWYDETLIGNYLRGIKELSGETARSLIQLIKCKPNELVKGLIYLKEALRRREIKNAKGYLISSFDTLGNFKYEIKPEKYFESDSDYKVTDNFEFEVDKSELLNHLKYCDNEIINIFFREEKDKCYISKITEAGRGRNIRNYLKRLSINYKIVSKYSE